MASRRVSSCGRPAYQPLASVLRRRHDRSERLGVERRAADEATVDVGTGEELRGVARFDASPVLDPDSDGDRGDFAARVRDAQEQGVTDAEALAAVTTTPARLLGVDALCGTIAPGKLANLVVVEGSATSLAPGATLVVAHEVEVGE